MKIIVKAKTKAKVERVERINQPNLGLENSKTELAVYKVSVREAPVACKANHAIIKALAVYFDTAQARIQLITGQTSKQKIFEIL